MQRGVVPRRPILSPAIVVQKIGTVPSSQAVAHASLTCGCCIPLCNLSRMKLVSECVCVCDALQHHTNPRQRGLTTVLWTCPDSTVPFAMCNYVFRRPSCHRSLEQKCPKVVAGDCACSIVKSSVPFDVDMNTQSCASRNALSQRVS